MLFIIINFLPTHLSLDGRGGVRVTMMPDHPHLDPPPSRRRKFGYSFS